MDTLTQQLEDLQTRIAQLEDSLWHKNELIRELCDSSRARYLVWSEEHGAWWSNARSGYTRSFQEAGRYSKEEVEEIILEANKYLQSGRFNEIAVADPIT